MEKYRKWIMPDNGELDNGECQTMENYRQWRMTDNGKV